MNPAMGRAIRSGAHLDKMALFYKLKGVRVRQAAENGHEPEAINPRALAQEAKAVQIMAGILARDARELANSVVRYTNEHHARNPNNRERESGPEGGYWPQASEAAEGPDPHEDI